MDGEKVLDSHWFKQLVGKHKKLCVQAAEEGLFVCIPQTCSLASWTVTARDVGETGRDEGQRGMGR